MIQNQQLAQLNAELRALREENAEQRRLLEQFEDYIDGPTAWTQEKEDALLFAITQHLKGKP